MTKNDLASLPNGYLQHGEVTQIPHLITSTSPKSRRGIGSELDLFSSALVRRRKAIRYLIERLFRGTDHGYVDLGDVDHMF